MKHLKFNFKWCTRGRNSAGDDEQDAAQMERSAEEPNIKRLEELDQYYQVDHSENGLLGIGHFAEVYRGVDMRTGARVAVKQISRQNQEVKTLRQEIAALLKVNGHPNIVQLYDVFIDQRMVVLVMELLEGGELFSRIVKRGAYTEKEASRHFRRITEALDFMHQHGIVHRDLKPENLVLSSCEPMSEIKISDFGLSKVLGEDQTPMTTVCGTSAYAAPEVGISAFYGPKVDTWSLGVILFVVLAAYHPFDPYGRLDDGSMRRAVCGLKWDFEDRVWKNMSDEVKDLITKLLCPAEHRLTAAEILQHPWITQNNQLPELNVAENSIHNLRVFVSNGIHLDDEMNDESIGVDVSQVNMNAGYYDVNMNAGRQNMESDAEMADGQHHMSCGPVFDETIPDQTVNAGEFYSDPAMIDPANPANYEPLPYYPNAEDPNQHHEQVQDQVQVQVPVQNQGLVLH